MADPVGTRTEANVKYVKDASGTVATLVHNATAGEALERGDWVYADATDSGKFKKASTSTAATSAVKGMAITECADDGVFSYASKGPVNPGYTVVLGRAYEISTATPGELADIGSAGVGDYATICGIGVSTTEIFITIIESAGAIT